MSLAWVRSAVHRSLGFEPYPGTLNVRLADPDMRSRWREVSKQRALLLTPPPPETCGGRLVSITLPPGVAAAVIVPDVTRDDDDVLEGISAVHLRSGIRLQDRAVLELTLTGWGNPGATPRAAPATAFL